MSTEPKARREYAMHKPANRTNYTSSRSTHLHNTYWLRRSWVLMISWKHSEVNWKAVRTSVGRKRVCDNTMNGVVYSVQASQGNERQGPLHQFPRKVGRHCVCFAQAQNSVHFSKLSLETTTTQYASLQCRTTAGRWAPTTNNRRLFLRSQQ